MKWSVGSRQKRYRGSNDEAAPAGAARSSSSAALMSRFTRRCARDVFQEDEVGGRKQVDAGQIALGDGRVRLVPETDVRRLLGDDTLNVPKQRASSVIVGGSRRFVEQAIDARILEEPAVEAARRRLPRIE